MPDYKEMYLIMARAAEKAQRILIEAQRTCEELYITEDLPGDAFAQADRSDGREP